MSDKNFPPLKYYKIYEDSQDLSFATNDAACFDVAAYLRYDKIKTVVGYDKYNNKIERPIIPDDVGMYSSDPDDGYVVIKPGDRLLVPSGIIFDIPQGYSVRTKPRSGTGYKIGLTHPHNEGIIDSDYFHETFLVFLNITQVEIIISHNQRLAQLEMIKKNYYDLIETNEKPSQKTDRIGGLGSTGK